MRFSVLCLSLLFIAAPAQANEATFNHSEWDQFLKKYVSDKGEVNYEDAKQDPNLLNAYVEKLKQISAEEFDGWLREERIALLINAYNAGVVKAVLDHYPLKTISQIPGVWDKPVMQIGINQKGKPQVYSLNQLQGQFLREQFRDEKILFAISSGAKDSPRLKPEAYVGSKLEGQLYLATREFVNDEGRNQIDPDQRRVVLSRLFKWYGSDFLLNWGNFPEEARWNPEETAVLSFFAHYLQDPKKVEFLKEGKYKVKHKVFDWALNSARSL